MLPLTSGARAAIGIGVPATIGATSAYLNRQEEETSKLKTILRGALYGAGMGTFGTYLGSGVGGLLGNRQVGAIAGNLLGSYRGGDVAAHTEDDITIALRKKKQKELAKATKKTEKESSVMKKRSKLIQKLGFQLALESEKQSMLALPAPPTALRDALIGGVAVPGAIGATTAALSTKEENASKLKSILYGALAGVGGGWAGAFGGMGLGFLGSKAYKLLRGADAVNKIPSHLTAAGFPIGAFLGGRMTAQALDSSARAKGNE
jgi:hypothetical protein